LILELDMQALDNGHDPVQLLVLDVKLLGVQLLDVQLLDVHGADVTMNGERRRSVNGFAVWTDAGFAVSAAGFAVGAAGFAVGAAGFAVGAGLAVGAVRVE
jgi:hypothetical protein